MQRIGQNVTIVGKVKPGGDANFIHLEGPDGGDIVVNREGAQGPYGSEFVEVVGMVGSDKTVTVRHSIRTRCDAFFFPPVPCPHTAFRAPLHSPRCRLHFVDLPPNAMQSQTPL